MKKKNGIVSGLVIQVKAAVRGRLQRKTRAAIAAAGICPGMGSNAINNPQKNATETEWRFKWKRLGSCSKSPRKCRAGLLFIAAGVGINRLSRLRAMLETKVPPKSTGIMPL